MRRQQRKRGSCVSSSPKSKYAKEELDVAPEGAEPRESGETDKAKALFCVKTGERIPSDAYSRRGHFITCCWGDCNPGDDVDGSKDQGQPPTDRKTEGKLGANMEIIFILNLKPEKTILIPYLKTLG